MNIENILIEGVGSARVFGDICDGELDIDCSNENLLNKRYFLTIYKTDDELNKQEQIGKIEMTYMDVCMAEATGYSIFMLFDMIDSEKQGVYQYLFGPGCLVLLANPFEIEGKEFKPTRDKEEIERLIDFYTKNGFERIEDTQYLVKNMDFE